MAELAPILVLGRGMLARAWAELLDRRGVPHRLVGRPELDLTRAETIEREITEEHRLVVNCAAWTDVDGAEAEERAAAAVNGEGVGRLGEVCGRRGIALVHYSTDYVFDGAGREPYRVDQPRRPINAYGRSKAAGEEAIERLAGEAGALRSLVVRTSWLYAPWGNNFVRTIARLCRERDSLRVVDDQRGRPSSCEHLAEATLELVRGGVSGVAHLSDGGECTWFEFASEINRLLGSPCRVEPCASVEFPRPAARPAYSVLDLSQSEAVLGPMPHWRTNLAGVMARLEETSKEGAA